MGQDMKHARETHARHLHFVSALIEDIEVLEEMIQKRLMEEGVERIGAEQEVCIVHHDFSPAGNSIALLEAIDDTQFTTELATYNMEINLKPQVLAPGCCMAMEAELLDKFRKAEEKAKIFDNHLVIAGILPTISRHEITLDYLTPKERYHLLSKKLRDMRGREFDLYLKGVDEIHVRHDSIMFEACNTSFQVHLQIPIDELVPAYNWALAISGPVLAITSNSPLLLGKELWSEIRIALFQQSIDTRHSVDEIRQQRPRVTFGKDWIYQSITEVYKEDITRFEVLVNDDVDERASEALREGRVPSLKALRMHNSTIYRWNRMCYGVLDNKPHMRIECRYMPAGPSVRDEIANTAFWIGLMKARPENAKKIWEHFDFKDVKSNFFKAARAGMESAFVWMGKTISAHDLIRNELLPLAHQGLRSIGMSEAEIFLYLGAIEKRLDTHTGARWQVMNYRRLQKEMNDSDALKILTEHMHLHQQSNTPVCNWPAIPVEDSIAKALGNMEKVRQLMSPDVFTVYPEDPALLVANIMRWNDINHIIVEDRKGRLRGVVTSGHILELQEKNKNLSTISARHIMRKDVHTIPPDTDIRTALEFMQAHWISSLPVVENGKLMGIVTKNDMLRWLAAVANR